MTSILLSEKNTILSNQEKRVFTQEALNYLLNLYFGDTIDNKILEKAVEISTNIKEFSGKKNVDKEELNDIVEFLYFNNDIEANPIRKYNEVYLDF